MRVTGLPDSESELHQAIVRVEAHTDFVEVLAQRSYGSDIRLDRSATGVREFPHIEGAAIRAWGGDRWLEVASRLTPQELSAAANDLIQQLSKSPRGRPAPGEATTGKAERIGRPTHPMTDLSEEERIAWARERLEWVMQGKGIVNGTVVVGSNEDERLYLNNAGARRYQRVPRAYAIVWAIAKDGANVRSDAIRLGGVGGREFIDAANEERVHKLARDAYELLTAKTPPLGSMNVLLEPGVAGVLAHESFGHGTEADQFVRERSYLRPLLGSVVGPPCLSIVDDGSLPTGWGSIYFDDEGHPSHRTPLIDHGRFVGILHDRTTAAALGGEPTGNSRRADFLSREWVRMTNTMIVPGERTREELVEEARDGVLLERWTSGIEDPLGGQMQIKVLKGHRIEGGKLTDLLGSMALSGRVLDVLRSVRGVSRAEPLEIDNGFCGKGHSDYIPDGTGGGYLLTRAIVGPA